jgi:alditol oxidase
VIDLPALEQLIVAFVRAGNLKAAEKLLDALEKASPDDFPAVNRACRSGYEQTGITPLVPDHPVGPLEVQAPEVCKMTKRFHNYSMVPPPLYFDTPADETQLQARMNEAVADWRTMRAMSGQYAFSNIIQSRDWVLGTHRLKTMSSVESSRLKSSDPSLVRVGAGVTVGELNRWLARKRPARTMVNLPGYEELSVIGVASVGGHGSGLAVGPLCEHVRSVDMLTVGADGAVRRLRIEPADGISLPSAVPDGIELLQDDELFHASTVSLGCLGIITSMVVQTQPRRFLQEHRELVSWKSFKSRWPAFAHAMKKPNADLHSVHLWVAPYEWLHKTHCTLLTYRWSDATDAVARPDSFDLIRTGTKLVVTAADGDSKTVIARWMAFALSVASSLRSTLPFDEAVTFGQANHVPVLASSAAIPADNAIDGMTRLLGKFFELASSGRYVTSPIGLRWVRGAQAHLAPQHGRDSCMIEVPVVDGTPKQRETLDAYLEFATKELGARPHWGQHQRLTGAQAAQLYPKFDAFKSAFRRLNPAGHFDSPFTEQLGLRS